MKKLITILLMLVIITSCEKQTFEPEPQIDQSEKSIKSGGVNVYFTSSETMITLNKIIIVNQLYDFEVWGYSNCNDMSLIKKFRTKDKAILFIQDITISGYYIIE